MNRYESYQTTPDLGYIMKYLRHHRCWVEDGSQSEEMDVLWVAMFKPAKSFLRAILHNSPLNYLPDNKPIDYSVDIMPYFNVLFETMGTYKQR